MHWPIPEQGVVYLNRVVRGAFQHYGGPMNGLALSAYPTVVRWVWRQVRLRSRTPRLPCHRMHRYINRWLPTARIGHPYPPPVRFGRITHGRNRMP